MPITIRHAPRGITGARARALYGAKRGAEQPWWDRFGRSMQTAAQMYGRQRLQERRIEAGEERMRMGAEFQERAGEARLGREKEMVDYRGEAAVQGIGQIGEAQRAEREKASRLREQKINEWVEAGHGTPEEAQPLIDNERRLRANMPPKQKEPTPEEIWQKTTRVDPETGKQFMKKGVWEQVKEAKGEAPRQRRRPGEPRDKDLIKETDRRLQTEITKRETAEKPMSADEQARRRREIYDQVEAFELGLEAPAGAGGAGYGPPPQSMEALRAAGLPQWGAGAPMQPPGADMQPGAGGPPPPTPNLPSLGGERPMPTAQEMRMAPMNIPKMSDRQLEDHLRQKGFPETRVQQSLDSLDAARKAVRNPKSEEEYWAARRYVHEFITGLQETVAQ